MSHSSQRCDSYGAPLSQDTGGRWATGWGWALSLQISNFLEHSTIEVKLLPVSPDVMSAWACLDPTLDVYWEDLNIVSGCKTPQILPVLGMNVMIMRACVGPAGLVGRHGLFISGCRDPNMYLALFGAESSATPKNEMKVRHQWLEWKRFKITYCIKFLICQSRWYFWGAREEIEGTKRNWGKNQRPFSK